MKKLKSGGVWIVAGFILAFAVFYFFLNSPSEPILIETNEDGEISDYLASLVKDRK